MAPATKSGELRFGLKIGDETHKTFELREAFAGDMFDAEAEADTDSPLTFNAALMCKQLVRIGTYQGPFTIKMLRQLKPVDYGKLRAAQLEVDALGEGEQEDSANLTTPSS